MPALPDSPLALVGYPASSAQALRRAGLIALNVPDDDLPAVLAACRTLRFTGALVHPSREVVVAGAAEGDPDARRAGRVDAVAFAGSIQGTYTLSDALMDAVEASGYAARGASALLIGNGADLARALPLARLGFAHLGVIADHLPDAERFLRELPGNVRAFAVGRRDPALVSLAERADLIVLTGGALPAGLLQPYHTLADLTGEARPGMSGAATLDLSGLPALRLSRQLLHATGQRYRPEDLTGLVTALA